MKLIVNNTTGRVINDYLLIDGDLECVSLLDGWTHIDGSLELPKDSTLITVPDSTYDFSKDITGDGYTNTYYYIDGMFTLKKIIEPEYVRQQIGWLEDELKLSDYRVIKAYEAQLVGQPLPYDMTLVHTQRQAIRDKINCFETLLNKK